MVRKLLLLLALVSWGGAAQAQWREAESRNFRVYSEASEAELRAFTEKLEKFDFVLRRIHKVEAPPSPNKLKIVLVPNQRAVATLAGYPRSGIAGYYVRDAQAMMMVGSRNRNPRGGGGDRGENRDVYSIDPEYVLLHEYTHHFMYQYFPATYPTWYSEGFAEFWGATKFGENGVVEVGSPAEHRFGSFVANRWLAVQDLLQAQNYSQVAEIDLLYAQGWLLVRYAWENPTRQKQLQQYLALINRGSSFEQAAKTAFGDLGKLNAELRQYSGRGRFNVIQLPFRTIEVGDIKLRSLGSAEQALFLTDIEWSQGVSVREFPTFLARVRREAAAFPNDPFALRLLADVERVANNLPASRAAVDKLLAVRANDPRGLMLKGLVELKTLKAGGPAAAFEAARRPIEQAVRLAPNDPLVHEALYTSYAAMGSLPPEHAQSALYRAMELAPSDDRLRYLLASDFEKRGMIPEAIAIIRPDAYQVPDRRDESEGEKAKRERQENRNRRAGTAKTETAREMLDRLLKKQQQGSAGSN
jgi:tetratricopeptide (TPR) repeat protein